MARPTLAQQAATAALEVLNGQADLASVLALGDHLAVAKHLLRKVAAGELVFTEASKPGPSPGPAVTTEFVGSSGAVPLAVALGMLEDRD
jgi:hypothetical protein